MTYRKLIIKHISILLFIVAISTENLSAITWSNYFPRWTPTREHLTPERSSLLTQLAGLMRPQLNYAWLNQFSFGQGVSRLSNQWSNLTPGQKNIFLYMTLFGTGGAGMAFWGKWFQQRVVKEQNKQPLKDSITIAKDNIKFFIKDINAKLNKTTNIAELDSLHNQLNKPRQTLENIKDELAVDTYNQISTEIDTLEQEIENKKQRCLRNQGKSADEIITERIKEQMKQERQSSQEFKNFLYSQS